ncbi:CBS domain-containing protein [Streptomyces sp. Ru72]|uniref:CBS domain-containing protein n=1 Tax=Streptomyces sp. Ru72 TaxID=2080747 RepID=UPI0035BEA38F
MDPLPSPLPASTTLADAADLLSLSGHGALPVTDDSGEYVGVVTAQAVAEALAEQPDAAPTLVGQLAEQPPRRQTDELRSPHSTDRTCSMRCCSTPDGSRCRRRTPSHPSASRPSAVPHPAAPEKGTPYPAGHTTWGPQQARKAAAEPHVRHFTCIMQNESGSEKSGPGTEA